MSSTYQVIDLFAGCGGLGEGFSSYRGLVNFEIALSVEMNKYACDTLRGRRISEIARNFGDSKLEKDLYTRYANSPMGLSGSLEELCGNSLWKDIDRRVLQATLGEPESNLEVRTRLARLSANDRFVLIGGPPCQAYSLAGRSRNLPNPKYDALEDKRNFLYREYLRQVVSVSPAVFVMENVKGLLSAKVNGVSIVNAVISDLEKPVDFVTGKRGPRYRLYSIVKEGAQDGLKPSDYVVSAEDYGVPQARHRVILLGVREDIDKIPQILQPSPQLTVADAIGDLPQICSGTTDQNRNGREVGELLSRYARELENAAENAGDLDLAGYFGSIVDGQSFAHTLIQPRGSFALVGFHNHESRRHMPSDLYRYLFVSAYASVRKRSPKGPAEFSYPGLAPNHANWLSGKFSDRFKCQEWGKPSSTITSHAGKDGHYYIHPDPLQCRSLTVREAARLQTFPDTYVFEGPKSSQFQQVGNAVPVALAKRIAHVVASLLS